MIFTRTVLSYTGPVPPPQDSASFFTRRWGNRETRVTGDEAHGTMGTKKEERQSDVTSCPFSPSRPPFRTWKEIGLGTRQGTEHICMHNMILSRGSLLPG